MKLPSCCDDMKTEHQVLATEGVLGVISGLTMGAGFYLGFGESLQGSVQKYVFDKAGGAGGDAATGGVSGGMTRIAGLSLAAMSTYSLHAGMYGSEKQRKAAYKITAVHSTVGAGLGALALAGKRSDATMSDDNLKLATGLLVANAAYFTWRALKNKKKETPVEVVVKKTGWGK